MTDEELVSAFLAATSRMSDPERAEAVDVTHTTIGRWRAGFGKEGGWKQLQAGTRRKLENYLRTTKANEPEQSPDESDDLGRRLDAIEALDVDELVKVVKIEAVSAAIRAEAARLEARAAALRAQAIERAEAGAEQRAAAIGRAEEAASARTKILSGRERPVVEPSELSEFEREAVSIALQALQRQSEQRRAAG